MPQNVAYQTIQQENPMLISTCISFSLYPLFVSVHLSSWGVEGSHVLHLWLTSNIMEGWIVAHAPVYLSNHPSIYLFIHQSIHPSISPQLAFYYGMAKVLYQAGRGEQREACVSVYACVCAHACLCVRLAMCVCSASLSMVIESPLF